MNGKTPQRRSLGRGLDALLGNESESASSDAAPAPAAAPAARAPQTIPIANIRPGKYQPRRVFAAEEIASLAQSIRTKGVLQPILVRPIKAEPGHYELVAGERRWRAAQQAQLHEIPALVRDLADRDTLEVALVENLQRQDLNALEEARGYERMMAEFSRTQDDVAEIVGKSRPHVANTLRLLTLPAGVQTMVEDGRLSAGHARQLVGLDTAESLAERVVAGGLSVRETERLAQQLRSGTPVAASRRRGGSAEDGRSSDLIALERDLADHIGLAVQINTKGEAGELVIRYKTLEQFDDLLTRLKR